MVDGHKGASGKCYQDGWAPKLCGAPRSCRASVSRRSAKLIGAPRKPSTTKKPLARNLPTCSAVRCFSEGCSPASCENSRAQLCRYTQRTHSIARDRGLLPYQRSVHVGSSAAHPIARCKLHAVSKTIWCSPCASRSLDGRTTPECCVSRRLESSQPAMQVSCMTRRLPCLARAVMQFDKHGVRRLPRGCALSQC